jgi:GDP-mannose 6-dehydrogenase
MADSPDAVAQHAEVCVVGSNDPDAIGALQRSRGRQVIDLVRFPGSEKIQAADGYIGVAW